VGEVNHFREKVVLAKVPKITFYCEATPGDVLTYCAKIEYVKDVGAMVAVTSHKGGELQAEGELVFAHLNEPNLGSLFDPTTFLRMMCLLGAYDVGRAADGSKLQPPPQLLAAMPGSNGEG
jgi:3-hydroxyacyl-[acyl-carrier-protein] dehydratase